MMEQAAETKVRNILGALIDYVERPLRLPRWVTEHEIAMIRGWCIVPGYPMAEEGRGGCEDAPESVILRIVFLFASNPQIQYLIII